MNLEAKQSAANRVWICLVVVVLLILFLETRGEKKIAYNLILNGGSECVGADVYVDGAKVGSISDSGDSGIGSVFWGRTRNGPPTVEVRKPSYKTFSKAIDMHREEYIGVDLQKATE
jgi:hypothetical protein